jgi:hypothetical protein
MLDGPLLVWAVCLGFILVVVVLPLAILHKPKRITYLSPEALDTKRQEIEAIRLDSISRAYTQEDIDRANEECDRLNGMYQLKRR